MSSPVDVKEKYQQQQKQKYKHKQKRTISMKQYCWQTAQRGPLSRPCRGWLVPASMDGREGRGKKGFCQ
jgi:hypothetical protein